jgi:hypothetical protein
MNYREALLAKILGMKAAAAAAATRKPFTAAPAAPLPPADYSSSAQAQPAHPTEPKPAEVIDLRTAALRAGYYIAGSAAVDLNSEFPQDAATAGWRASLNRPAPNFGPPDLDVTNADAVERAYQTQVRVSKEKKL